MMNFTEIWLFFIVWLVGWSKHEFVTSCPSSLQSVCTVQCQLTNGEVDLDCSKATDLKDLIKHLRAANVPIRSLRIHKNDQLTQLPGKLFSKLTIKSLDLSGNGITDMNPRVFMGLENHLTSLNLSDNKLTTVPDLSTLQMLEYLDVSGNALADKIKDDSFAKNPQLKRVKIGADKVMLLPPFAPRHAQSAAAAPAPAPAAAQAPSATNVLSSAVGAPLPQSQLGLMNSFSNPMNALVGASLLSELVRNLPMLSPSALWNPANGGGGTGLGQQASADISNTMPEGWFQQYAQQMQRSVPSGANVTSLSQNLPSGQNSVSSGTAGTGTEADLAAKAARLFVPGAPLPPLSSLPPDLVSKVLLGGSIPGMSARQTEDIKKRYTEMLFGGSGLSSMPPVSLAVASNARSVPVVTSKFGAPTAGFKSSAPINFLRSVPSKHLPHPNGSSNIRAADENRLTSEAAADLAAGRLPNLTQVPPEVTKVLLSKEPQFFDKVIDALKGGYETETKNAHPSILDRLPPPEVDLFKVHQRNSGPSFQLGDLDKKTYINDLKPSSDGNVGLYTGLGLGLVGLLTTVISVFFCVRLWRNKRLSREAGREANVGSTTVYLGTPPMPGPPQPLKKPRAMDDAVVTNDVPTVCTFQEENESPPVMIKEKVVGQHQRLCRQILPEAMSRGLPLPPLYQSSPKRMKSLEDNVKSDAIITNESTRLADWTPVVSQTDDDQTALVKNKF